MLNYHKDGHSENWCVGIDITVNEFCQWVLVFLQKRKKKREIEDKEDYTVDYDKDLGWNH